MYYIEKQGVYGHGVFWIGESLEKAVSKANKFAKLDRDNYHSWAVCEFIDSEQNTNAPENSDDEWTFCWDDAERKEIYSTEKDCCDNDLFVVLKISAHGRRVEMICAKERIALNSAQCIADSSGLIGDVNNCVEVLKWKKLTEESGLVGLDEIVRVSDLSRNPRFWLMSRRFPSEFH